MWPTMYTEDTHSRLLVRNGISHKGFRNIWKCHALAPVYQTQHKYATHIHAFFYSRVSFVNFDQRMINHFMALITLEILAFSAKRPKQFVMLSSLLFSHSDLIKNSTFHHLRIPFMRKVHSTSATDNYFAHFIFFFILKTPGCFYLGFSAPDPYHNRFQRIQTFFLWNKISWQRQQ